MISTEPVVGKFGKGRGNVKGVGKMENRRGNWDAERRLKSVTTRTLHLEVFGL